MNKEYLMINSPGQTSIELKKGVYKFDLWGAEGGIGLDDGKEITKPGKGAHVSGKIILKSKRTFYLFIGGKGSNGNKLPNTKASGGFNGGGNGGMDTHDDDAAGAGGGATDVRLINGTFDDQKSLYSRIIVAAGGSGSVQLSNGAPGGDLTGYIAHGLEQIIESSTTQTKGYKLGIGEDGKNIDSTPSSGSGGGYYGGFAAQGGGSADYVSISSSGSSYISGFKGCNSVNELGKHTNSPFHYSGLFFLGNVMQNGNTEFRSPLGEMEKGHSGNGAIKIVKIGTYPSHNNKSNNFILIFNYIWTVLNENK